MMGNLYHTISKRQKKMNKKEWFFLLIMMIMYIAGAFNFSGLYDGWIRYIVIMVSITLSIFIYNKEIKEAKEDDEVGK